MRPYLLLIPRRCIHEGAKGKFVKIGNVRVPIRRSENPEYVPQGHVNLKGIDSKSHSLKWLLQKDHLKQDVFLIGVPGSIRSDLVLDYLELCNREFEYLALTRDTTEADIKQRREIRDGSAFYTDLCAVRAALNGRVLVIDGVEKAERNVLPILNNLLENREMQLDDGRFLMAPQNYDKLLEKYSAEELSKMKLERVSDDFHVVALGLPVPKFKGHTLDPPLRSRFQCLNLSKMPFDVTRALCNEIGVNVDPIKMNNILGLSYGINIQQEGAIALPRIPIDNLIKAIEVWNEYPSLNESQILEYIYPKSTILRRDNEMPIYDQFLQDFSIQGGKNLEKSLTVECDNGTAKVTIKSGTHQSNLTVSRGNANEHLHQHSFVSTSAHEDFLSEISLLHSKSDFCILGGKGCGKTALIQEFAKRFNYHTETITLYQDMNSRELLQQRRMLPNGDTIWQDSQLISAAKEGHLCILDGLEKIHWSTVEVLAPLIYHRFIHLPDGTRLISDNAFSVIKEKNGLNELELNQKGVYRISPNFRLVALADAESANASGTTSKWLNDQILSLFLFKTLPQLSLQQEIGLITKLVPNVDRKVVEKVLKFTNELKESHDANLRNVGLSLSLRKLISIFQRYDLNPEDCLHFALSRSVLAKFLPSVTKTAFNQALDKYDINPIPQQSNVIDAREKLRNEESNRSVDETLIPKVLFYENEQQSNIMNNMAIDLMLSSPILLIGNQGVGKNKITDYFLQTIRRPRVYMQLHRDTTVQSLTVQSTVVAGKLNFEDSPLVKAVKEGLVLVVDEADKAPLHVIAILKSLLDSGYLYLSDGRRIQPQGAQLLPDGKSIEIHPDFRIIMLANRPGFPFLGNDLFGVLGDLFAIHVVHNPDRDSEITMLRKYGPNVKQETIEQLVNVFDELRTLSDDGHLAYPYSTRELVNIVKHVEKFPEDPLVEVVRNVFDFDVYSKETVETIENVFKSFGIPLGLTEQNLPVQLTQRHKLEAPIQLGSWNLKENVKPEKVEIHQSNLVGQFKTALSNGIFTSLSTNHIRAYAFTEQAMFWQLELNEADLCSDVLNLNQRILVASVNPPTLHVINNNRSTEALKIDLYNFLPKLMGNYRPRIIMTPFGENQILVHEEMSNTLLCCNLADNYIEKLQVLDQNILTKLLTSKVTSGVNHWRLIHINDTTSAIFYRSNNTIVILRSDSDTKTTLTLPDQIKIDHIVPVNDIRLMVFTKDKQYLLTNEEVDRCFLRDITSEGTLPSYYSNGQLLESNLDVNSGDPEGFNQAGFLMANPDYYGLKSRGFPESYETGQINAWVRPDEDTIQSQPPYYHTSETNDLIHPSNQTIIFPNGLIVRALSHWDTPSKALPKGAQSTQFCGSLEVVDTKNGYVQYIPVPHPANMVYYNSWAQTISEVPFVISRGSDLQSVYTVDSAGGVRKWEINESSLFESYNNWRRQLGVDRSNERVEIQRGDDDFDLSKLDTPKFGKIDPANTPHQGGNTWAGGTGGYNTAGLGGIGGPFRLDAGHDVKQMSDQAKAQVPEEIKKKARQIAQKEYQKRLKEIDMSEHDASQYEKMYNKIGKQVTMLKNVIESLQAKEKERQWAKNQTSGDLDDGKLIEGITGEKNIFRRRVMLPPDPGAVQTKPKRLQLLVDVSGSMYRFNGYDHRLQRTLESTLLVMEALKENKDKVIYDIVGHSGESAEVMFTQKSKPPVNEKERMDVLKKMLAHSQFCFSGDYTLEAIELAAHRLAKESDVDERFVIAFSDANLDRYGIKPQHLARAMQLEENVNVFLIFIGTLGAQAERLKAQLPSGKTFVIQDTSQMPVVMKEIFASTLVK